MKNLVSFYSAIAVKHCEFPSCKVKALGRWGGCQDMAAQLSCTAVCQLCRLSIVDISCSIGWCNLLRTHVRPVSHSAFCCAPHNVRIFNPVVKACLRVTASLIHQLRRCDLEAETFIPCNLCRAHWLGATYNLDLSAHLEYNVQRGQWRGHCSVGKLQHCSALCERFKQVRPR